MTQDVETIGQFIDGIAEVLSRLRERHAADLDKPIAHYRDVAPVMIGMAQEMTFMLPYVNGQPVFVELSVSPTTHAERRKSLPPEFRG